MISPRPARIAVGVLFCVLCSFVHAGEWWVAVNGSDDNPGTREKPFASLEVAVRNVRNLRRLNDPAVADGARIIVRGGEYALTKPVRIVPEDSGTPTSPTTIEAAPGERPIFSGAQAITRWQKPKEPIPGLSAEAQNHVVVAEIPQHHGRPMDPRALWFGERKGVRARTPNEGTMAQLKAWERKQQTAGIPASLLAPGVSAEGLELIVQQQWEIGVFRAKSVERNGEIARLTFHAPESEIEFAHPWPQPMLPPEGAGAFFLANRPEFLDQPGEWWFNRQAHQLVYWPRGDEDAAQIQGFAPSLETLFEITGSLDRPVEHITFRGLEFRHTSWQRPSLSGHVPLQLGMYLVEAYKLSPKGTPDWHGLDNQAWVERPPAAVMVDGARHLAFERCRFEHLAMNGLDFVRGVTDSKIEGCLFHDVGGNAIFAGYFSDRGTEAHLPYNPKDERELCGRLRIANNLVSDGANEDWGCAGIAVGYARDVAIEHNEIRDVSYTGISVGWGWTRTTNASRNHRIHANLIHHIATRLCDTAGVYTLSAQPGTEISENVIRDVTMSPYVDRPEHWFYLYLDEGSSEIRVHDNWCPEERFLKNANGPGNVWENNGPQVSEEVKVRAGLEEAFRSIGSS